MLALTHTPVVTMSKKTSFLRVKLTLLLSLHALVVL